MKKYNGTAWVDTTLRQYKTATANIEPTVYTDGTAITSYTIKGNTVQNGTPTPSAPIAVQGVGELDSGQYKIPISSANTTTLIYLGEVQTTRKIKALVLDGTESLGEGTSNYYFLIDVSGRGNGIPDSTALSTHTESGIVVNGNGTALFFKKSIFVHSSLSDFKSYLSAQYANGTPVTIWYVLATPETATVNEPLMKIGTYADTLSNATAIPTTEGANSITVDTTVQPSEFTATWTGWHNATVKEWDGSGWQ